MCARGLTRDGQEVRARLDQNADRLPGLLASLMCLQTVELGIFCTDVVKQLWVLAGKMKKAFDLLDG